MSGEKFESDPRIAVKLSPRNVAEIFKRYDERGESYCLDLASKDGRLEWIVINDGSDSGHRIVLNPDGTWQGTTSISA